MTNSLFFRLLDLEDKASVLADVVASTQAGYPVPNVTYSASVQSLGEIPGTPFAYWVSQHVRRLFRTLARFESDGREARITNETRDDPRWIRAWWEVDPGRVGRSLGWVNHAKGGAFSPYYSDLHLVIAWDADAQTYPGYRGTIHRPDIRPASLQYFFRAGLTWSRRSQRGFSVRILPCEAIFGNKGPAIFTGSEEALLTLLGLTNSAAFRGFVNLQMAFGSYETGVTQRSPVPPIDEVDARYIGQLALSCFGIKRELDTANEVSHVFCVPAIIRMPGQSLTERLLAWTGKVEAASREMEIHQKAIDDHAFELYGITDDDRQKMEATVYTSTLKKLKGGSVVSSSTEDEEESDDEVGNEDEVILVGESDWAASLVSYALGSTFGRWDVRMAIDATLIPSLGESFQRLPICSPGMLIGPDGSAARRDYIVSEAWLRTRPDVMSMPPDGAVERLVISEHEYRLQVSWDGIAVDDRDHPDDVVRRLRAVFDLLFGPNAEAMESEACELLDIEELGDYLRSPKGFFDYHIKRYSKSRRKAPIYWLLQSAKRSYGLWLYYHRLDGDLLYKAQMLYVEPKVRLVEGRLAELDAQRKAAGTGGAAAKELERAVARQEALLAEVTEFRDRLARVTALALTPDLDDGVLLNIAPLWELVPWKAAKDTWQALLAGRYGWSSIAKQLQARGLAKRG